MQKILLSIGACAVVAAIAFMAVSSGPVTGSLFAADLSHFEWQYMDFVATYSRSYKTRSDFLFRLSNFRKALDFIANFESDSMTVGINDMSDWTNEEFIKYRTGRIPYPAGADHRYEHLDFAVKDHVDWRETGDVTPVRAQGSCGSCWAFSATASLEGLRSILQKKLDYLSPQQLMECSWDYGNSGCQGGLEENAFRYVVDHGITLEDTYPYIMKDNKKCHYK